MNESKQALVKTQMWKLWAIGVFIGIAGVGFFFNGIIGKLFDIHAAYVELGATLLFILTFFLAIVNLRCPSCRLSLVIYSISRLDMGDWLEWLFTVKSCPKCGFPHGRMTDDDHDDRTSD